MDLTKQDAAVTSHPMDIDILIEDAAWDPDTLAAWADRACGGALRQVGLAPEAHGLAILACDDARIADLNAEFRGKPHPTNVLSWPATGIAPGGVPPEPELGDIAIAHGVCAAEAAAQGKPFEAHVTHLLIHATLHLLGYDHETDADAAAMEAIEIDALAELGLPDPY